MRNKRFILAALILALPAAALAQDALPIAADGWVRAAIDWLGKPGDELVKIVALLVGGILLGEWIWTRRPGAGAAPAAPVSEAISHFTSALVEVGAGLQSTVAQMERMAEEQRETAEELQRLTVEVREVAAEVRDLARRQTMQPPVPIPAHVPCPHGVGAE